MRFRTTWRVTACGNGSLRCSTFASLRMARVIETVSRCCFNPRAPTPPEADLRSWGDIRELGDTPKPSAASCCTSSVIPAKLVLVKTGSGNPGVDVGRAKRSETRRHSLPFNLPLGEGVSRGILRDTLGLPAGSVPASNAGLSSATGWPCPGKRPRIRTVPRCLPRCHRSPSPSA
jgi:hypothetical protein